MEPFMGTGVVAFNAGFGQAVLGDVNPHVIRFYKDIQTGKLTPLRVRAYLEEEGGYLREAGKDGYEHYTHVKIGSIGSTTRSTSCFCRERFQWNDEIQQKGRVEYTFLQETESFQ